MESFIEHFANLTHKHKIDESKQILLNSGMIKLINDSQGNQHIVLDPKNHQDYLDLPQIHRLYINGVTTIPILTTKQLETFRTLLLNEMKQFPEYLRNPDNPTENSKGNKLVYTLGGFAGFGNPSSFHNPTIRKLRTKIYQSIKTRLFKDFVKNATDIKKMEYLLETLLDRFMYRLKNTAPPAESWHRDIANDELIDENDEIFGSWINLDTESQYFSCIPGSHLGITLKGMKSGFATINKQDIELFKPYRKIFEIKPGHFIVFPQYILHEVLNKKKNYDMMRLFIGWRLTTKLESFHKNNILETILTKQGNPLLPSGQKIPLYSSNHGSYFLKKEFIIDSSTNYKSTSINWSIDSFKPELLVDKINSKNEIYQIVDRFPKSLEDYNLTKYPPYTIIEKQIYFPHPIK